MTERLDRIIQLLEQLVAVAAPTPPAEPKKREGFFVPSSLGSRGRAARLVGEMRHQHPHEADETGLPPAGGGMTPAEHWRRQPRGV